MFALGLHTHMNFEMFLSLCFALFVLTLQSGIVKLCQGGWSNIASDPSKPMTDRMGNDSSHQGTTSKQRMADPPIPPLTKRMYVIL